ncbi:SH3 domain-containing protein Dlish isoform X2 [Lepeophtheirus salmonis]|nr:SH3 domain-containing protein Dlish-like isoform X2 [Lepeophtheirus salmonis]
MAFLCPVRIKRSKKKKQENVPIEPANAMGRITGSASIETLVRVGIEKENGFGPDSKMVVLHDFIPCVDDELEVKRGQIVHVLYQENDWVYVISENELEGFIPHSYCALFGSQLATLALNVKKKLPRDFSSLPPDPQTAPPPGPGGGTNGNFSSSNPTHQHQPRSLNTTEPFGKVKHIGSNNDLTDGDRPPKIPSNNNNIKHSIAPKSEITSFNKSHNGGSYVVLYSYIAQDENDLTVERGQVVTLLNSEDSDWYWVSRYDSQEGFVPSGYIYPLDAIHRHYGLNKPNPGNNRQHPPPKRPSPSVGGTPSSYPLLPPVSGSSISNAPQNQTGVPSKSDSHSLGSSSLQHFTSENSRDGSLTESVPIPSGSSGAGSIVSNGNNTDIRHHGTELIMLYDYKAQAPDDLTVKRGDWVYADMNNQTVDGWLWTYAVKSQRYGFIPKAYARPPATTNL